MDWQTIYNSIQGWIGALKRANRAQRALLLGILVSGSTAFFSEKIPKVGDWLKQHPAISSWVSSSGGILVGSCILYAALRIWRAPVKNDASKASVTPSALKGGEKYGLSDGELFLRLGRLDELQVLWGWVADPRVPLVAVQAESGVGKSSLLESGLQFLLTRGFDRLEPKPPGPIPCVCCEMLPADPASDLLRALNRVWTRRKPGPPTEEFTSLGSVLSAVEVSGERLVVLVDQLEQLSLTEPRHAAIFEFLRQAACQKQPCPVTCIIAYRKEYASEWNKFCAQLDSLGIISGPKLLPLELLKKQDREGRRAQDILATLGASAGMKLDDIAGPLIDLLADKEGRVLPFDLSISLRCLHRLGKEVLAPSDLPAGGLPSLLAGYLQDCLAHLPQTTREAVFAAIYFKLVEKTSEGKRRRGEGLPLIDLGEGATIPLSELRDSLERLADRETGLLEKRIPPDGLPRYRILHERFIPALEQLAGMILADTRKARAVFNACWHAYDSTAPNQRLLRGSDLKLVSKNWDQLPDVKQMPAQNDFFVRSVRCRSKQLILYWSVAAVGLAVVSGWWKTKQLATETHEAEQLVASVSHEELLRLRDEGVKALCTLAKAKEHARFHAVRYLLTRPLQAKKFRGREQLLAHVVVGLDPGGSVTRKLIAQVLQPSVIGETNRELMGFAYSLCQGLRQGENGVGLMARILAQRMTNTTPRLNTEDFVFAAQLLSGLSASLTRAEVQPAAAAVVARMTNTAERLPSSSLAELGLALGALNAQLERIEVQPAAFALLEQMTAGSLHSAESDALPWLGKGLGMLSAKLNRTDVQLMAAALARRMTNESAFLENRDLASFGHTLVGLRERGLERGDLEPACAVLSRRIMQPLEPSDLSELGAALTGLSEKMQGADLEPVAGTLLKRMTNATEKVPVPLLAELGIALGGLAPKLNIDLHPAAAVLTHQMISTNLDLSIDLLLRLGDGLSGACSRLTALDVKAAVSALVRRVTTSPEMLEQPQLIQFRRVLNCLSARLEHADVQPLAAELVQRMTDITSSSAERNAAELGAALTILSTKLTPADAEPLARALTLRITRKDLPQDICVLAALTQALSALSAELLPADAYGLARELRSRMRETTPASDGALELGLLGQALAALSQKVPDGSRGEMRSALETCSDRLKAMQGQPLTLLRAWAMLEPIVSRPLVESGRVQAYMDVLSLPLVFAGLEYDPLSRLGCPIDEPQMGNAFRQLPDWFKPPVEDGFHGDIWQFVDWAAKPEGGGKLGIIIPRRPL